MHTTREEVEEANPDYYKNQTRPAAYRLNDEEVWKRDDVSELYPEILEYYRAKGITDIRIMPCGPVDEDVLYVNGQFRGYCRMPFEWKMREDLTQEDYPPKAKRRK